MTTYIAFQVFYTDDGIDEGPAAEGWKVDNSYIRRRRRNTLGRLTQ